MKMRPFRCRLNNLIDRYLRNIETYRITSDNLGGAYKTVTNLLSKGHQQIALISPDNTNTTIEDRTQGFEKAYMDGNILIDKNLWCHVPIDILRNGDTFPYIVKFLHQHPNITAVFALTSEMALLLEQFNGQYVPQRIEVPVQWIQA